jgi:hypothetical protein
VYNGRKYWKVKMGLRMGDNGEVGVEADFPRAELHYFVNDTQLHYIVAHVHTSPLLFGLSAVDSNAVVEILSLQKLTRPTFNCKEKYMSVDWFKK